MKATSNGQERLGEELRWTQTTPADVTTQKQAEVAPGRSQDDPERRLAQCQAELTRLERFMDALLNNNPDRIFFKDAECRFLKCNQAVAKRLGFSDPNQVVGKTDFDLHPTERAREYFQDDQRIIQSGEPIINKIEKQTRTDGEIIWASVNKIPLRDENGNVVGLVGINRDITDYMRAEQALTAERTLLRTVIDNLPDCVYAKDTTGRKTLANLADLKNFHYSNEAEAIGRHDFELFPKDIAEKFWADDQKVLQGQPVINREEHFLDEAGRKHWLLISKLPLRNQQGDIVGLIGVRRDVTEIKQAEAKLEQAHQELVGASRRAGMAEVATNVLHNVGNVLNSVNVASACVADIVRSSKVANLSKIAGLLREHADNLGDFITNDSKGKQLPGYLAQLAEHLAKERTTALEDLDRLRKNIEHVKDIVAMQQNYAKASGVLESLPIVDLVEDAIRMYIGSLERQGIKVLREYAEAPQILVDKHKVLQVLVNLISNAKHACDDSGKPDKQITLRVANGDGRIKISVIDNGVGIPAENITRIFNHGFTTRKDGHGFGLHSGALAAKEMGGSLAVTSEGPERGANFTLELPIQNSRKSI